MSDLIRKISFFSKNAFFEDIEGSNSGALVKKVYDNNNLYFLKVLFKDRENIDLIKETIKIYNKNNIKTVKLLDYGYIDDRLYLIYNFIDGYSLNKMYDKYSLNDYYNFGIEIGTCYRNINLKEKYNIDFDKKEDINILTRNIMNLFIKLYNNNLGHIKDVFPEQQIKIMCEKINELLPLFKDEERIYIYGDMHPKNIMIDDNKDLYIIDIENLNINYFIMDMRWSILAAFKNKYNNAFFKGYINGHYKNEIPDTFYKHLKFILLFNFMEHINNYSKSKDDEFISKYILIINDIFNKIDIYSNNRIDLDMIKFE